MTRAALRRIWGLVYRHLALYRRSWPRVLELMYWPILQMVVWGFVTAYLAGVQNNTAGIAAGMLLGGVLLWEVTLRSQMGFSISFLEEIWSRNLGHIFVSPLRTARAMPSSDTPDEPCSTSGTRTCARSLRTRSKSSSAVREVIACELPTATASASTWVASTNATASSGSVRTWGAWAPSLPPTSPSSAST